LEAELGQPGLDICLVGAGFALEGVRFALEGAGEVSGVWVDPAVFGEAVRRVAVFGRDVRRAGRSELEERALLVRRAWRAGSSDAPGPG